MIITNPLIQLKISGSNVVAKDISETFVLDTKLEQTYSLQDTTPEIELDLTNITNKKILVLSSDQDFILHCYKEITSPMLEVFEYSFDIPVNRGLGFVLNTTADFFSAMEKFTISTGNVNLIKVSVSCYGEYIS